MEIEKNKEEILKNEEEKAEKLHTKPTLKQKTFKKLKGKQDLIKAKKRKIPSLLKENKVYIPADEAFKNKISLLSNLEEIYTEHGSIIEKIKEPKHNHCL